MEPCLNVASYGKHERQKYGMLFIIVKLHIMLNHVKCYNCLSFDHGLQVANTVPSFGRLLIVSIDAKLNNSVDLEFPF